MIQLNGLWGKLTGIWVVVWGHQLVTLKEIRINIVGALLFQDYVTTSSIMFMSGLLVLLNVSN